MKTAFFAASVALLCALTVLLLVVGNGNPALAVLPTLVFAVLYAIWKLPLRYPLLILTFLALTLENPGDDPASGAWKSPLYNVGAVLMVHLNVTFDHKWMMFSGLDVILVYLLGVALYRWASRSRIDSAGRPAVARPMRFFVLLVPAAALGMWVWGVARGGADFASSLWQVQRVGYLPIFFVLFAVALRGAHDRAALAKVFILAACIRAALAVYVRETVVPPAGHKALEYATTHPDSILFAGAVCLVVALLVERFDKRRLLLALVVLPILVAGMVANTRRIVWVDLAVGLFTLYSLTPWTRARRAVTRAVIVASPVVLIYFAVGWSASSETFAPVEIARSVVDSKVNQSTEWRDWENYDLVYTLRQNPIIGSGYGHGYIELVKLPDISQVYELYRYIPHNSILGLWAYGGIVGFAALWSIYSVAIFFAARIYRRARGPSDRIAALASTGFIAVYLAHCYGDMGLGTWTSVFTIAPSLAVIGQLATATGAWPGRKKPDEPRPVEHRPVEVLSVERTRPGKEGAVAA